MPSVPEARSRRQKGRRVSDRDVARLVRRGEAELAGDPAAAELRRRIRDRENAELDRDHRARSDSAAVAGFLAGLLFLAAFVVGTILTFER